MQSNLYAQQCTLGSSAQEHRNKNTSDEQVTFALYKRSQHFAIYQALQENHGDIRQQNLV